MFDRIITHISDFVSGVRNAPLWLKVLGLFFFLGPPWVICGVYLATYASEIAAGSTSGAVALLFAVLLFCYTAFIISFVLWPPSRAVDLERGEASAPVNMDARHGAA